MKKLILFSVCILWYSAIFAQTANVTKGCSPLEVNFTAPDQASYYWTFQEGNGTSTEKNPQHIFTTSGEYTVTLFNGQGGTKVGEIAIKVYKDPKITVTSDKTGGCSPLKVKFLSAVEIDPEIQIVGYKWTFGDGSQDTNKDPEHIFSNAGVYDVSLQVTTDLEECNKTEIFFKYITTIGIKANFTLDKTLVCDAPATLTPTIITPNDPSNQYFWDFGNGNTSTLYNPGAFTLTETGDYTISLSVTNLEGCVTTLSKAVTIGKPVFNIAPPKEICFGKNINFLNNTNALYFDWEFLGGDPDSTSTKENPKVAFKSYGDKAIKLSAYNSKECIIDTTFIIKVQNPNADFSFDTTLTCIQPLDIVLSAANQTYKYYNWSIKDDWYVPVDTGRVTKLTFTDLDRDSLYLFQKDTLSISLAVITDIGCSSDTILYFSHKRPNAHFKPDYAKGCAPLTVTFEDLSDSFEEIVTYKYDYGNGDTFEATNNSNHSYTFTEPGDYFVKNVIENSAGCKDTSAGVWIRVGSPITPEFEVDKTEVCLGESITATFSNTDPRIDAFHIESDDGRFNHCWTSGEVTHTFSTLPGVYPVSAVVEYNGCFSSVTAPYNITVKGAKADLGYMINCDTPYDVMLTNESTNDNQIKWTVDTTLYNDIVSFTHTFPEVGDYKVVLEATDTNSGCASTFDSTIVHIRLIKADFELDSIVCENNFYTLYAANSEDVNATCNKGYLWYTPSHRPLEFGVDTINTNFPAGDNAVTLVVEDINGCTNSITKYTRSFAIDPMFTLDKDKICLPASLNLSNTSTSDTTIVNYYWQGIDTSENIILDIYSLYGVDTSIFISLELKDAVGCKHFIIKEVDVYEISTMLDFKKGFNFCVGNEFPFSATDFTEQGSQLNFHWDIEDIGEFEGQSHSIILQNSGLKLFTLMVEEESSGCADTLQGYINVVNLPEAKFISDADGIIPLCSPRIIDFTNQSVIDGQGVIQWKFSNAPSTLLLNPSQAFDKGTHEVELIARSVFGCSDTIKKTYVLIGPEGEVVTDKTSICLGEEIEFTLINPVEVNEYQWDFGDGITTSNISPVKHVFDRAQTSVAKLVLKSAANLCDLVIEIPFNVNSIDADFELYDTTSYCEGLAYILDLSADSLIKEWDFNPGMQSLEDGLFKVLYPSAGTYDVTLKVSDSTFGCEEIITKAIVLEEIDDLYKVPNLFTPNGDGENDLFRPVILNPDFEEFIKITSFKVYNRWGNLVYDNADPNLGWNGEYNGQNAPAEVYAYYLQLEVIGCNSHSKKGNVTLMR